MGKKLNTLLDLLYILLVCTLIAILIAVLNYEPRSLAADDMRHREAVAASWSAEYRAQRGLETDRADSDY